MDLGHAVRAVRTGDGEVSHSHLSSRGLLDEAHPTHAVLIARVALLHVVEESTVDLIDDLQ